MTGERPRLLLLDGHSLAYRAFYALPVENFSTSTGQPTNAVYGFTSMLINVLRDEEPTHVAVAFDKSRETFRAQEYAEYKAKRNKTPDEFRGQVPLIQEVLDALAIQHLELAGYEADDIIATLATKAQQDGFEVFILTGDRDSLQLVTPQSTVLYPMRGVSDLVRLTPDAVEAKYGVPPHRYPELAALVGEDADNLPGVPGVGPKTAAKWLAQYDGLENVINHADQIAGKAGQSLRDHLDDVVRNRRLNALVTDLDLGLGSEDLKRQPWDRQEVHTLFDGLEFRVLRDRLFEALDSDEAVEDSDFALDTTILDGAGLADWLSAHARTGAPVGVQIEGIWHSGTGDVRAISFATGDGSAGWIEVADLSPEVDQQLADWLADASVPKVMHDAKGQLLALAARGLVLRGLVSDTALAAYLVRPDQRSYDLADLTLRYLKRELKQGDGNDGQLALDMGGDDGAETAMLQARAVLDLSEALSSELTSVGGTDL
ncbi:MAG TPA: 5'-3' exonuclease H3TH domain-containing protein, partial [Marmoricola sp.]|nr:5'-3' exonuclease H3TH domain-containing protein [Marmoricola sp.]